MIVNGLYTTKESCNGCGACLQQCSCNAITMIADEEGFLYPNINEGICIDCHLCERICPQKNPVVANYLESKAFGLKHNDQRVIAQSTSGGAFTALYEAFFNLYPNGIVYGCILTSDSNTGFTAKHIRVTSPEECAMFRGSKYIQSVFWPILEKIESDLKDGHQILVVGTPCQIAAVSKCYSRNYKDQLVLIDLICHSVPSPLMFNEHIKSLEHKSKNKICSYSFRPKSKGWHHHEEAYEEDGTIILNHKRETQRHKELFYAELISRPSCSQCQYVGIKSVADITIGDFWGIEHISRSFWDGRGVSLVIIHNDSASRLFSRINSTCSIIAIDITKALSYNHHKPSKMNENRTLFWEIYYKKGYEAASRRFLESSVIWNLKKLARTLLSAQTRASIKKMIHHVD